MDIKDILDSLGLDLTNPEAKRGAVEAIQAILDSRTPPPDISGMPMPKGEVEVEIDPDLLQPSQKYNQPESDEDIEIEDDEDVLRTQGSPHSHYCWPLQRRTGCETSSKLEGQAFPV